MNVEFTGTQIYKYTHSDNVISTYIIRGYIKHTFFIW